MGDGVDAALLSYVIGWVLLTIVLLATPSARDALRHVPRALRGGDLAWWALLGGVGGATLIASQSLTVPILGVALFTVAVVAGQTASSLAVDRSGLVPGGVRAVTPTRLAGAVLATVAVVVAVEPWSSAARGVAGWALALAVFAGVLVAGQQTVNGQVTHASGSPLAAAWINFAVGTAVLGVVALLRLGSTGEIPWDRPWLLLGGVIGATYVVVTAAIVRTLGVLMLSLTLILGQLLGAVALDAFAPTGRELTIAALVGAGLTVVAVVLAASGRRERDGVGSP
jgi:transporter family-2 protein